MVWGADRLFAPPKTLRPTGDPFRTACKNATIHVMLESKDETQLLEIIRERITRSFQPLRIILFGSRARGSARPDSDVDSLVVFRSVTDKRRAAVEIRRVLSDLPVAKDIIVTTPDEIARRGNLVGSVLRPALREGRDILERT